LCNSLNKSVSDLHLGIQIDTLGDIVALRQDLMSIPDKINEIKIANLQLQATQDMINIKNDEFLQYIREMLDARGPNAQVIQEFEKISSLSSEMDETSPASEISVTPTTSTTASTDSQKTGSSAASPKVARVDVATVLRQVQVVAGSLEYQEAKQFELGTGSFGTVYRRREGVQEYRAAGFARVAQHPARGVHHVHVQASVYHQLPCGRHTGRQVIHSPDKVPLPSPVPCQVKLIWLHQVAIALRFLHLHDVLHRDLKPANVLLVQGAYGEYIAKMADFGVSTAVGMSSTRGTNSGKVGTCMYMAPELFDDELSVKEATSATLDIYAFGVTANELFSGERPWEGRNDVVIAKAVDKGKRPAAFTATSAAEEALLLLIGDSTSGCLHQDRACRPAASHTCDTLLPLLERNGKIALIVHRLYVIMLLALLPLPPLNKLTLTAAPSTGKYNAVVTLFKYMFITAGLFSYSCANLP
jgi:hypothetical protein